MRDPEDLVGKLGRYRSHWISTTTQEIMAICQTANTSTKLWRFSKTQTYKGAVIGDKDFKTEYCQKLTNKWIQEMAILSEIALTNAATICLRAYMLRERQPTQADVFPENHFGDRTSLFD